MKTIQIGSQVWTTKNLRVFKFRNGDPIPIVQDNEEWSKLESPAMCINPDNGECYYNWYAVDDPRGLAPEGFHVPSDDEWQTLIEEYGGRVVAGNFLKSALKWNGTGRIDVFNALPCGARAFYRGEFYAQGVSCKFWSSSYDVEYAWFRSINSDYSNVDRGSTNEQYGFSVRLIKD
jgi:uncharacterized protein (TIGR02145 family)